MTQGSDAGEGAPPQGTSATVGRAAVRLARRTLEGFLTLPEDQAVSSLSNEFARLVPGLSAVRGVFVTLWTHPGGELRGCVGFPVGREPLHRAVPRATLYAAREDPRFPPLHPSELPRVRVEVSLLTPPRRLEVQDPADLPKRIRVGLDGLIVRGFDREGLLLPQVAPEQGWDANEFLDGVSRKAGLPPGVWRQPGVELFTFQAEVFSEPAPAVEPGLDLPRAGSLPRE
jgi:uncharacterized protein (TIGR00296 family)